jgi:hypothetical protein
MVCNNVPDGYTLCNNQISIISIVITSNIFHFFIVSHSKAWGYANNICKALKLEAVWPFTNS